LTGLSLWTAEAGAVVIIAAITARAVLPTWAARNTKQRPPRRNRSRALLAALGAGFGTFLAETIHRGWVGTALLAVCVGSAIGLLIWTPWLSD